MKLSEVLDWIDFSFKVENGKIKLIDLQGANLGDIEAEEFETIEAVINRLDWYLSDVFLNGCMCFEEQVLEFNSFEELKQYCDENNAKPISDVVCAIINPETITLD